jgi:hypothetical protein
LTFALAIVAGLLVAGVDLIKPKGTLDALQTVIHSPLRYALVLHKRTMSCNGNEISLQVEAIHANAVYRIAGHSCDSSVMTESSIDGSARTLKEAAEAALQLADACSARTLLDRALALYADSPKGPIYAQVAIARADIHWSAQELKAASDFYCEALRLLVSEFGEESDVVGICLRNLSEIYREQGDSLQAKQYKKRWQEIMRRQG